MQVAIPEILIKNKDMWYFDGWKTIPKPDASAEVAEACRSFVEFVKKGTAPDTGLIQE
ncbi:MAG: hypothetical protein IJ304_05510 [Clostridia bacterium]|nr:hypothetical protein [Clostridia bacterium]